MTSLCDSLGCDALAGVAGWAEATGGGPLGGGVGAQAKSMPDKNTATALPFIALLPFTKKLPQDSDQLSSNIRSCERPPAAPRAAPRNAPPATLHGGLPGYGLLYPGG